MKALGNLLEQFRRNPSDITGIDLGYSGIKIVRMRKAESGVTVTSAGILPPIAPAGQVDDTSVPPEPLIVPGRLKARYASLALSAPEAVIKLLGFPASSSASEPERVMDGMGLDDPSVYRIGYSVVAEGHGRSETRVLAAAVPDAQAEAALLLLPAGLPAPFSLEVSGIATMTAFAHSMEERHAGQAVGLLDCGARTSTLALFNARTLALIRRFDVGTDPVLARIRDSLGVDDKTARGIIVDGAFDVSQSVAEVMDAVIKQIVISRDFVERRENCSIDAIYLSGNESILKHCADDIASATGTDVSFWDPFETVDVQAGALPEEFDDQKWRFSAAMGACLATLETA